LKYLILLFFIFNLYSGSLICQCFDFEVNNSFLDPSEPAVVDEKIKLSFTFCNKKDALELDALDPLLILIENEKLSPIDSFETGIFQVIDSLFNAKYSEGTWTLTQRSRLPANTCINISSFFYVTDDSFSSDPNIGSVIRVIEPSLIDNIMGCNNIGNNEIEIFTYTVDFSPPVDLISFTASQDERVALLEWETTNEISVVNYLIERSYDGIEFTQIGIVESEFNSSELLSYSYIDSYPRHGFNYYRFKQIDAEGEGSYSPTRSLFFDLSSVLQDYEIVPNPIEDYFRIIGTGLTEEYDFKILDTYGNLIQEGSVNKYDMTDVSLLNSGIYIVFLFSEQVIIHSNKIFKL